MIYSETSLNLLDIKEAFKYIPTNENSLKDYYFPPTEEFVVLNIILWRILDLANYELVKNVRPELDGSKSRQTKAKKRKEKTFLSS